MKILSPALLGLSLAAGGSLFAAAQEMHHPPKVLEIEREFIKPGKAGSLHDKSESHFVADMAAAKWPTHYIALNSLSGKLRALYLTGYDSFASVGDDNKNFDKNAALSAELDKDSQADGELLDGIDQFVFTFDEDLSYRPDVDIAQAATSRLRRSTSSPAQQGVARACPSGDRNAQEGGNQRALGHL
jgi:hypothetical protein